MKRTTAVALLAFTVPATVGAASQQLELVAEEVETILKAVENTATENALTYQNFLEAAPDSCDTRLGLDCFDTADAFSTMTQYIMYSQIALQPSFAFVNLHKQLSDALWGFSGWAQDLSGFRYYFDTDDVGHTDCYFPSDPSDPATVNLSAPAFGFDYNPVNDSYIQKPLRSPSAESWTHVYPFNITTATGWTIDMFASYGVYNNVTNAITSVDVDVEMVDSFAKGLALDHGVSTIVVLEASTGILIAVSNPEVRTHRHDHYALTLAIDCPLPTVAAAVANYGDLTDGETSKTYDFQLDQSDFVVDAKVLDGHTGASWIILEVTNATASHECACEAGEGCTCFVEERTRVDLVHEEVVGILDAVEGAADVTGLAYQVLQGSPTHSSSSFDVVVRFLLFAQLSSGLDFAFVNLNTHTSENEWGLNGWAADSGTQYYYDTMAQVTECWYASPTTLNFSSPADIAFSYNTVNDSYIQLPLGSPSGESWTAVYPWQIYNADGSTQIDLFVSYGIYNNVTDTISSADLDITILDQFVKRIGVDLESKPGNRLSYVFVVEAPSGKLLAISDPRTATHEGWTIFSAFDANNSAIVADAVTQYGHSLADGEISKHYAIQSGGVDFNVVSKRVTGYTGMDWLVFQATQPPVPKSTTTIPSSTTTGNATDDDTASPAAKPMLKSSLVILLATYVAMWQL